MNDYFILKGKKVVPASMFEWAEWLGTHLKETILKQTTLKNGKWVSTVFLGLNHNLLRRGKPLFFETMVFPKEGNWEELDMERYSTYEEAEKGHERMIKKWGAKMTTQKKEKTKEPKGLQFVSWFPGWKGFCFKHWEGNMRFIYSWSLVLGFWEIRKWQTKSFEDLKNDNLKERGK